jgi:hypothetical protein
MSKKLVRRARLARKIAEWLVPVLTVIKLLIEIVGKAANCNAAYQLRTQVPSTR